MHGMVYDPPRGGHFETCALVIASNAAVNAAEFKGRVTVNSDMQTWMSKFGANTHSAGEGCPGWDKN